MGLLTINGIVRVKQLWPAGRSDADTITVELASTAPFLFEDSNGRRETHAFDNAEARGKFGPKPVIKKSKKSSVRKVAIRLQGVDAPELHCQPIVPGAKKGINHPFRQNLGETSAHALHAYVSSFGLAEIPCRVLSVVQRPGDVFDVYGRAVGNLVLLVGGVRIDVNQWLLREGWALPGLYNSMTKAEILAVVADHDAARKDKRGLFSKKIVTPKLVQFDPAQRARKGPASFKPFSDKGAVNFPKFFRRQAEMHVRVASGHPVPKDLRNFITIEKKDDTALERKKFLKLTGSTVGSKPRPEFKKVSAFLTGDRYPMGPELVYWENDSDLFEAGTTTKVTKW